MSHQLPTTDTSTEGAKTYDWETVIACGVALLLQSRWDGAPVADILARATGESPDTAALRELREYVTRTLEPMK